MKKKTIKIIIGIILALVILIGIYFLFKGFGYFPSLAIGSVPTTGCGLVSQGQRGLEFTCTDKTCYVNGFYHCNSKTGEVPTVIFRTNSNSLEDYNTRTSIKWIAINGIISGSIFSKTSDLHVYCVTDSIGGSVGTIINPPAGKSWIYFTTLYGYNGKLIVKTRAGLNDVYRSYELCDTAGKLSSSDLSIAKSLNPNPSYTGKEVTSGSTNPYQCLKNYQWLRNGQTVESNTITYSGQTEGDMETGIKQLQLGDIFKFDLINYAIYGDTGTQCSKDVCSEDRLGIYKCVNSGNGCSYLSKVKTACPSGICAEKQDGTNVECTNNPYYLTLSSINKESITNNEEITYTYKVESSLPKADNIKLYLKTPTGTSELQGASSPNMPYFGTYTIPKSYTQTTGAYEISLVATYGTNIYTVGKKSFNVAIPIYLSTRFYSIKGGTGVLYTNEPAYVQIDSWDSVPESETKNRVDIKNANALAKLNNGSVNYESKECSFGSCTFKFNLEYPGLFSYDAIAESLMGFKANVQGQTEVKQPYVKPEFTNEESLACVLLSIPIKITFQTKNPQGELLESNNKITIEKPSGEKENIDVSCPSGDCSFSYTFQTEGGFKFIIGSSSQGYIPYPGIESGYAYAKIDCIPPECTKDSDCITPKSCVNNRCVEECNNWTCSPLFYYIIIGGGIGIIALIILLIVVLKRRKPEPGILNL